MDTSSGMLNLKIHHDVEIDDGDDEFVTIGPVNGAVLFDRVEVLIDPFEVQCLAKPHECTQGLSLAFWINILEVYGNGTLLLSQGYRDGEKWPGVKFKVFTRGIEKIFQISVTIDHPRKTRCEVQFKYNASTWMHVAFTWYNGHEMYLYLNGIMQFSVLCIRENSGLVPPPTSSNSEIFTPFILGSTDAAMLLDDVALWDRWLKADEVHDIYYTVIEGKRTITVHELRIN